MIHVYKTSFERDNRCVRAEVDPLTVISEPVIRPEKNMSPMWGFYLGPYDITRTKQAENFTAMTALLLDYDSGIAIAEIQAQLRNFWHYGYTSYNHHPRKPRFRVVLPLSEPIPLLATPQQRVLLEALGGDRILENGKTVLDNSTFARGRFFYQPALHPDRQADYKCWHSRSEAPIDTSDWWTKVKQRLDDCQVHHQPASKPVTDYTLPPASGTHEHLIRVSKGVALEAVEAQLGGLDFSHRGQGQGIHMTLLSCNARLFYAGFTAQERGEILGRYSRDEKTEAEIQAMVSGFLPEKTV